MAKNLENKVVVITGGAMGIGFAIAEQYLEKRAKIAILLDVNEKQGANAVKKLNNKYGKDKAVFIECDVTKDLDQVSKQIIDTYKTVDVLVNNAGILNETQPAKTIGVNITALVEWSLKFWEHMRNDKGGKGGTIVNLASIYGFRIDQFLPVYQSTKFAVYGFTKSLGHEYNFKRSGVRVVVICPGFSTTSLIDHLKPFDNEHVKEDFSVFLSKQLFQNVDSVANAAVEVFEKADSGSAWQIEGGLPSIEV